MNKKAFLDGIRDGIPICLGYLAVSFSLGIAMRSAGLTSFQGFLFSATSVASAGEYAAVQVIQAAGSYLEIAIVTLIANMRYLLMSASLSQRFKPNTNLIERLLVGYGITDEIFGITINRDKYIEPSYNYGAILIAIPGWAIGTSLGIIAGNILPTRIVSALAVALFGMFLAIIIPAAKKDKIVMYLVIFSFIISFIFDYLPFTKNISSGTKVIIITIFLSTVAAYFFPIKKETIHE